MNYRVIYSERFRDDVRDHVAYLRSQGISDHVITGWYERLFDKLDALDVWPRTFAVSEPYSREAGRVTHKYNFGKYLIFYQIDDEQQRVELVAFFHGAKDWKD